MSLHVKAFIAALMMATVLGSVWWIYRETLLEGMQASQGARILNEMEKNGVPDVKLTGLDGQQTDIKEFKDKVVIVNFWASWCAPCVEEFPSMLNLASEFPNDMVILAISGDSDRASVDAFLKAFPKRPANFLIFSDPNQELAKKFGTQVLPESYVLERGLKVYRKVVGTEKWDSPSAIQFFKEMIKH